jgi:hypothetical protein
MKRPILLARPLFCLLLGAMFLLATGCKQSQFPKTVSVQGKITYQGKPVPSGTVGFVPVDDENRPASGEIAADGTYRVSSFRKKDGVMPGEYKVTIQSFSSLPTVDNPQRPTVSRIPMSYTKVAETSLKFTVPADAGGSLTYDIDLK